MMADKEKSPLDIALEAAKKAELDALGDYRAKELEALRIKPEPEKKKRQRGKFRVIKGGK
jgi:hypothetical protein